MALRASSLTQGPVAPKIEQRTGLPLVPCPKCGEDIMELTCGAGSKVLGAIFFKCRRHERDVPGSCPWYLFVHSYEMMLIENGLYQKSGTVVAFIRTDESFPKDEQIRTKVAPLLDDVVYLKTVNEKLEKLIVIGKIAALYLVVVAVCVVVGVIIMLVK